MSSGRIESFESGDVEFSFHLESPCDRSGSDRTIDSLRPFFRASDSTALKHVSLCLFRSIRPTLVHVDSWKQQ